MKIYNNLIVIDGLDGVGKTSTSLKLGHVLSQLCFGVVNIHFEKAYFQGSFSLARKMNNPNIKYFLQLAALSKLEEEIKTIYRNKIIICDRYFYSINAYYSSLPKSLRIADALDYFAIPEPRLKIILECSSDTRRKRLLKRDGCISPRKALTLTAFGDTIQSKMLRDYFWIRINNEHLSISECVSLIVRIFKESRK
jgi:thymidylate kinase